MTRLAASRGILWPGISKQHARIRARSMRKFLFFSAENIVLPVGLW
jgi:hypothetical protein